MRWLPDDRWGPSLGEFVDVAATLGARSITALEVDGRRVGVDRPLDEVAEAFAGLCDRAADAGLLVHLEYFPFSGIPDLATATAVARAAGRENGGVMVDFWHHVRGPDAGTPDFAAVPVIAMQVGDVAATPSSDLRHEMVHGRVLPGAGAADVVGLLRALRAAGCTAPAELEVYSDALAALEPIDAARAAHAALTDVLAQAGLR
jgi:sugar phosphate isomerase/epimerase